MCITINLNVFVLFLLELFLYVLVYSEVEFFYLYMFNSIYIYNKKWKEKNNKWVRVLMSSKWTNSSREFEFNYYVVQFLIRSILLTSRSNFRLLEVPFVLESECYHKKRHRFCNK